MRRIAVWLGLAALLLGFVRPALAGNELIVIERPFHARALAGVVVDWNGAPVPGVTIEDCDPAFDRVLASTTTDASGHFAFPEAKIGTTHYLRLKSNGFNQMHIAAELRHLAKGAVRVRLVVAT